jgi:hypothetical protein
MSKVLRQCLAKNTTEQDSAWYYSLHFFIFFQQQSTSKHSHFFHFLYHINNFFITIRIKYSLKYNFFFLIFFSLFYTNSFYFISHYHFLLILKLTIPLLCFVPVFTKQDLRSFRFDVCIYLLRENC